MTRTLIIAMPDGFDLSLSRASQTIRWGYYHGAQQAGLEAQFAEYSHLHEVVERSIDPIVWLTYDDYRFLDRDVLRMLRDGAHIVGVNTWFQGMEELHKRFGAPSPAIPQELRQAVLDSEPDFVWASAPEGYLDSYQEWRKAGMKVVSLPWACDTARYYPSEGTKFAGVEMAFVGGYRSYKEPQYNQLLWPYGDRLKIWGYSKWPRCYQGYLPNDEERQLYTQARLCPTISEPQFRATGDTVERPFKIMGCRGLTILDAPCYRELFGPDEAPIATGADEYHVLVQTLMKDDALRATYREAGYQAVMKRHTYMHRVIKILGNLYR